MLMNLLLPVDYDQCYQIIGFHFLKYFFILICRRGVGNISLRSVGGLD